MDIDECIKLVANMSFFKNETAFLRGERTARMVLADVRGNVRDSVDVIRFVVRRLGGKRTMATCPSFELIRLHSELANAIMGCLQDGVKDVTQKRDFDGNRWGVDPRADGRRAELFTERDCVL